MAQSIKIAGGAWTRIVCRQLANGGDPRNPSDYTGPSVEFSLASGASFSEDFNVQPLQTLGFLGPIEHNSFGYNCQLTVDTIVSKDKTSYDLLFPKRALVQRDGQLQAWLFQFQSTDDTPTIYDSFLGTVFASMGRQIQANAFVTQNTTWHSLERY